MQRLYFVQWLRVFLIVLVVAHHAGQPYGPTGGAWPVSDPRRAAWLGPFFGVNAAYFMGFFFLIAGYFTRLLRPQGRRRLRPRPADPPRHSARLLRVRRVRAAWSALLGDAPGGLFFYSAPISATGRSRWATLWFVAQLLAYSLLYALWRQPRRPVASAARCRRPATAPSLVYVLALAIVGFSSAFPFRRTWVASCGWCRPSRPICRNT